MRFAMLTASYRARPFPGYCYGRPD